ncbi:MAG: hypothetical protein P4L40_00145, partial [Terracidiphilus sp.]|nr:hypothetical protein [Terracidiphilus sp.]
MATALKLSEDDDATIDSLKKQIEKAWAMVESYHERELRANETIQKLKGEISNLTRILEKQSGVAGKDNTVDELLKVRGGCVCVCVWECLLCALQHNNPIHSCFPMSTTGARGADAAQRGGCCHHP